MAGFEIDGGRLNLKTLLDFADVARRIGAQFDIEKWLTRAYVSGIEVTQGIQYYRADRHLTNADDRGPDNSGRLAAQKPAWVRVYVRSGLLGADQDLTGDLVVERRTGILDTQWTAVAPSTRSHRAPSPRSATRPTPPSAARSGGRSTSSWARA